MFTSTGEVLHGVTCTLLYNRSATWKCNMYNSLRWKSGMEVNMYTFVQDKCGMEV